MRTAVILAATALVACGEEEKDTGTPEVIECDFDGFDQLAWSQGQLTGSGATQGLAYWAGDQPQKEILFFEVYKIEEGTYEFNVPASYVDLVIWTGVSDTSDPRGNHESAFEVDEGTVEITDAMGGITNDKFSGTFHDVKLLEADVDAPRTWCLPSLEFSVAIDDGGP